MTNGLMVFGPRLTLTHTLSTARTFADKANTQQRAKLLAKGRGNAHNSTRLVRVLCVLIKHSCLFFTPYRFFIIKFCCFVVVVFVHAVGRQWTYQPKVSPEHEQKFGFHLLFKKV